MVALYGFSGDLPATNHLCKMWWLLASLSEGLFLSWGITTIPRLRARSAVSCNRVRSGPLMRRVLTCLPKSPTRTRRIDYGLCHHLLWAQEVLHFEQSFSDHVFVAYRVNADAKRSVFFPPKVQPLSEGEKTLLLPNFHSPATSIILRSPWSRITRILLGPSGPIERYIRSRSHPHFITNVFRRYHSDV